MGDWRAGGGNNVPSPGLQFRSESLQQERTAIAVSSSLSWYFQSQRAAAPTRCMQQPCCWDDSPATLPHPPPINCPSTCHTNPSIPFSLPSGSVSLTFQHPPGYDPPQTFQQKSAPWACPLLSCTPTELSGSSNTISSYLFAQPSRWQFFLVFSLGYLSIPVSTFQCLCNKSLY